MSRRKRTKLGRMSAIFISAIVSLSIMGVGYGYWSESLQVNVGITTGNIKTETVVDGFSNLDFYYSDENHTLYISGEMHPYTSEDLEIKIFDVGTVPVVLEDINVVNTTGIVDLNKQNPARFGLSSLTKSNVVEEFNLNITPTIEDNEDMMIQGLTLSIEEDFEDDEIQRKINAIYDEINDLENELNRLNKVEYHNFRYDLRFIQGI